MASTYSTNLAIELIGTGEQSGTWGTTTNTNLGTLIEQAISGYVTQAITDGADTTITIPNGATGVARNMYIECTGALTDNRNLIVPANRKLYFIYNNTTGSKTVTVKVSGQTGVTVPNGSKMLLVCNGTDVVSAVSYFASVSMSSLTVTGTATIGDATFGGGYGSTGVTISSAGNIQANGTLTVDGQTVLGTSVGVGVTPSAWGSGYSVLQVGPRSSFVGSATESQVGCNAYYNGTNWKYIETAAASQYGTSAGAHSWLTAASGTAGNNITWTTAMTLTSAGLLQIGARITLNTNTIYDPTSGGNDCGIGFGGGNTILPVDGAGSATNGTLNLGSGTYRWNTIYATNGTINTSDARGKTEVRSFNAAEVSAAAALAKEVGVFKFLDAVAKKGDTARSHIGMTVQRVIEIMKSHGLDPFAYGFICYDKWEDSVDGVIVTKAGDAYGFRPDELMLFIARGFEARLAALEAK